MQILTRSFTVLMAVFIVAQSASAHPGHVHPVVSSESHWHYFLQPEHGLLFAAVMAVGAALLVKYFRQHSRLKVSLIPVRRQR